MLALSHRGKGLVPVRLSMRRGGASIMRQRPLLWQQPAWKQCVPELLLAWPAVIRQLGYIRFIGISVAAAWAAWPRGAWGSLGSRLAPWGAGLLLVFGGVHGVGLARGWRLGELVSSWFVLSRPPWGMSALRCNCNVLFRLVIVVWLLGLYAASKTTTRDRGGTPRCWE